MSGEKTLSVIVLGTLKYLVSHPRVSLSRPQLSSVQVCVLESFTAGCNFLLLSFLSCYFSLLVHGVRPFCLSPRLPCVDLFPLSMCHTSLIVTMIVFDFFARLDVWIAPRYLTPREHWVTRGTSPSTLFLQHEEPTHPSSM